MKNENRTKTQLLEEIDLLNSHITKLGKIEIAHNRIDKALRESEEKFKVLYESSQDAIMMLAPPTWLFTAGNQATIKMFHAKNEKDFISRDPWELSPKFQPDGQLSSEKAKKMIRKTMKTGSHFFEWTHNRIKGENFPATVLLTRIELKDKQLLQATVRDVTKSKKIEEELDKQQHQLEKLVDERTKELKEEKDYYHSFVTSLKDWVWEMDLEGIYTYSNPAVESILGYKVEDVVGHHISELWLENAKTPKHLNSLKKTLSLGKSWKNLAGRFKHKNGSLVYIESTATPIYNSDNKLVGYRGLDHDITQRKKAEETLKTSEQNLKAIFNVITDIILEIDYDGKYHDIAPTSPDLLYKPSSELLGKTLNEVFLPKKADQFLSAIHQSLNENKIITIEYQLIIKNKNVWFEARIAPKTKKTVLFISRDITERKRAEQIKEVLYNISNTVSITDDLKKMISRIHEELGTIIDTTNFYVALYDNKTNTFSLPFLTDKKDNTIVFPAGKTLTNYVRKTQKPLLARKNIKKKLVKSGDVENFGVDEEIWLGVPLKIEEKVIGVLAVQSYTDEFAYDESDLKMLEFVSNQISILIERKRTELELIESEKRYKYLFEQSPTSIWEQDFSEVHRYITSLKKSGIKDFRMYFKDYPKEVKKCVGMVSIIDLNKMSLSLYNAKNKHDLITNLDSILTEDSLPSFIDHVCSIAENKTRFSFETINRTLDGKLINLFIKTFVVPGYEEDYSRVLVSLMDVTGQKKAEKSLRIGRERLKSLNQIIRHDLANDFIVIKSAINLFRKFDDVTMIDEIEKRAIKSIKTIGNYRNYESFIDSNTNLYEVELAELINNLVTEFPTIEFNIKGKCKIFADDAMDSVFKNLISNSIIHGNSTQIIIIISSKKDMCNIRFLDNGTGIPDKFKDRIFDKGFFYGKSGNTGIGLNIVKNTIERYGGHISVEDNEPNGAMFVINLRQSLAK